MKKYWWIMMLRGFLAVLFAMLALFWTNLTLEILIVLFAVFAIGEGFFAIIASIQAAKEHEGWGLFLLEGVLGIVAGVFVLHWPEISVIIFVYFIAFWALATGILELLMSGMKELSSVAKTMIMIVGILSIILGVAVLVYPLQTVYLLIWFLGIYALIGGIAMIIFSSELKKML